MNFLRHILACTLLACTASAALPQSAYPSRPIRIIYPGAPGGVADGLTRLATEKMSEELGQPFVIDYRAGGNGVIGADALAKAAPDGYTIGYCNGAMIANALLHARPPYDTLRDFTPISLFFESPYFLAVSASLPVKNVEELVLLARAKPGQLGFATPGVGSTPHLSAQMFMQRTQTELLHVPYKAVAPSITGVASGETQIAFSGLPPLKAMLEGKKLRILASMQPTRSPFLPEVPSIDEAGVPGLAISSWQGFCAPASTPSDIRERLAQALAKATATPEMRRRFANEGAIPTTNTPSAFRTFLEQTVRDTAAAIKAAGIQPGQ